MSRESVTLEMLKYIIRTAPQNRKYHQTLYDQVRLPKVLLHSPHEIKACSEYWGLKLKNK